MRNSQHMDTLFLTPSSLLLSPGRYITGSLDLEKFGCIEGIDWSTFQPSIKYGLIFFTLEFDDKCTKPFGKIVNHSPDTILLSPKFLFGFVRSSALTNAIFLLQQIRIAPDNFEEEILPEIIGIYSYNEVMQICKVAVVEGINVNETRIVSSSLDENNCSITIYLCRIK